MQRSSKKGFGVLHSGLTKEQSTKIEMVQKKALVIILGSRYQSYESALVELDIERLDTRRENLCYKFALKCSKSHRHRSMFPPNPHMRPNMRSPKPFLNHTSRHYNSAVPYLARLLNERCDSKNLS